MSAATAVSCHRNCAGSSSVLELKLHRHDSLPAAMESSDHEDRHS
jgi:hypothetical protein